MDAKKGDASHRRSFQSNRLAFDIKYIGMRAF